MATKHFQKALSVGLSLALCASMTVPAFAASLKGDLGGIDLGGSIDKGDLGGNLGDLEIGDKVDLGGATESGETGSGETGNGTGSGLTKAVVKPTVNTKMMAPCGHYTEGATIGDLISSKAGRDATPTAHGNIMYMYCNICKPSRYWAGWWNGFNDNGDPIPEECTLEDTILHYAGEVETLEDGTEVIRCTVPDCGKVLYSGEHLEHKWSEEYVVKSEATCTKGAIYEFTCEICGETAEAEQATKLPHNYGRFEQYNNKNYHYAYCTECGDRVTQKHEVSEDWVITVEEGYVKAEKLCVCGYGTTNYYYYNSNERVEAVSVEPATCEEPEWTTYEIDKRSKNIVTGKFEVKTTTVRGITAPALGHDPQAVAEDVVPATCTAEGSYVEVTKCSRCDEEFGRETKTIEMVAHTPGETVIENEIPATATVGGSRDEVVYCTECDVELSRETVTNPAIEIVVPVVPGEGEVEEIDAPSVPLVGLMTRAEFVNYLYVQAGSPTAALSTFTDVSADHEYAMAIGWAEANGITLGVGNGKFDPDAIVTVEQADLFLERYAQFQGIDMPELSTLAGKVPGEILDNADEVLTEFFG